VRSGRGSALHRATSGALCIEDIGNADPQALGISVAARDAADFIGYPECKLALAQCVVYLALAPKSVAIYYGYEKAATP
jgi:putative ATPase